MKQFIIVKSVYGCEERNKGFCVLNAALNATYDDPCILK
jgi:hypothetical protein